MPELPHRNYSSVPFPYALGVIVGTGVARIEVQPAVDIVHLTNGRVVRHWRGDDEDCGWEVSDA